MKYLAISLPLVLGIVDLSTTSKEFSEGSFSVWKLAINTSSAILLGLISLGMIVRGKFIIGLPLLALAVYNSMVLVSLLIYLKASSPSAGLTRTENLISSLGTLKVIEYTVYIVPSLLVVLGGLKLVGKFNQFTY